MVHMVLKKQSKKYPDLHIERRIKTLPYDEMILFFDRIVNKYPEKRFYLWAMVGDVVSGYPVFIASTY